MLSMLNLTNTRHTAFIHCSQLQLTAIHRYVFAPHCSPRDPRLPQFLCPLLYSTILHEMGDGGGVSVLTSNSLDHACHRHRPRHRLVSNMAPPSMTLACHFSLSSSLATGLPFPLLPVKRSEPWMAFFASAECGLRFDGHDISSSLSVLRRPLRESSERS